MKYEEANQVLNNVKFGLVEPTYRITQALVLTGDLDTFNTLEHKLISTGFLDDTDRTNINPPRVTRPNGDFY
jgi:hypothetical protein